MERHSLYNFQALFPPGQTIAMLAMIQCLLSHPVIHSILEEINEEHKIFEQCRKAGKTIIIITTLVQQRI